MTIAQSDTYPETTTQSRGKTLYRWNIHEIQVMGEPDGKLRTAYEYSEISIVGKVTRGKILAAMRADARESDDRDIADAGTQYDDAKSTISLSAISELTYVQLDTYIETNITDLVSARVYLKKLSKVVLALLKREDL